MRHIILMSFCLGLLAAAYSSAPAADSEVLSRQQFERLKANERQRKEIQSINYRENELKRIEEDNAELLAGASKEKLAAPAKFAADDLRRAVANGRANPGPISDLEIEKLRGEYRFYKIKSLQSELKSLREENAQLRKKMVEREAAK
jgi:hypothetical protein